MLPVNRVLKTALHAEAALMLFVILNLILGKQMEPKQLIASAFYWESIGNSNWYVVTIICLYLITWLSFRLCGSDHYKGAVVTTILSLVFVAVMIPLRPSRWYDTSLCYVMGIWYSLLREKLESLIMKNGTVYVVTMAVLLVVFRISKKFAYISWIHQINSILFMMVLIGLSMKVCFDNGFLRFMGKHVFSIYILQRLPMIYLTEKGILSNHTVGKFAVCFVSTCIMAVIFDKTMGKLDTILFPGRKQLNSSR